MTRENGYYWVQLFQPGPWVIAKWYYDKWYYNNGAYEAHYIYVVHYERIEEPDYGPGTAEVEQPTKSGEQ